MALYITHYPNKEFSGFSSTPVLNVDLNTSVRRKLNKDEQLTNNSAIKIFRQIKLESDIVSFLTKPIVVMFLSAGLLVAGLSIPTEGTALLTARVFVGVSGAGLLTDVVFNSFSNGLYSKLSQAYRDQSQRVNEYISTVENADHEMRIVY